VLKGIRPASGDELQNDLILGHSYTRNARKKWNHGEQLVQYENALNRFLIFLRSTKYGTLNEYEGV